MADITLVCKSCGASLTLSEYAKPDNLTCPACKALMSMPEAKNQKSDRFLPEHLRQAKAEAAKTAGTGTPDVPLNSLTAQIHNRPRRRFRMETFLPVLKASLLFAGLTALFVYLRYFRGYTLFLEPSDLDLFRLGGAGAILFFHVVIVIEALTSSFLTGLLCLLLPGYSLYYLFTESDTFWLRAVILALAVAFGRDFVFYTQDYALSAFAYINAWLAAGGEFNKPLILK